MARLFLGPDDFQELLELGPAGYAWRTRPKLAGGRAGAPERAERIDVDDGWLAPGIAAQEAQDLLEQGYEEVEAQRFGPSSAYLAHHFGVQDAPERLARFYDSGEWEEYEDCYSQGAPGWQKSVIFYMSFCDEMLPIIYEQEYVSVEEPARYIPLSMLNVAETLAFFATDISSPECPVVCWSPDTYRFSPWRDSLDAFLEDLE